MQKIILPFLIASVVTLLVIFFMLDLPATWPTLGLVLVSVAVITTLELYPFSRKIMQLRKSLLRKG